MVNADEIKKRIVSFLHLKGPSLPVQISRDIKMSTLFVSAFLSELIDEKKIKISNLKVGGTPLYLIEGQEHQLENFQKFLHPKEQEALLLLKNKKILKDSEQDPAIRVALRAIKDFAFAFKKDEETFWRYLTVTEQEVKELLEPEKIEIKAEIKTEARKEDGREKIEKREEEPKQEIKLPKPKKIRKIKEPQTLIIAEFENPLASKPYSKPEKIKLKSEFVQGAIKFLEKSNFKILEEKEYKAKEYNCLAQINTELGPISFLTQAKDKKTISDKDLEILLRQAQSIPIPALMLYSGNLNKKAIGYQEKYYSVLKTKKIY